MYCVLQVRMVRGSVDVSKRGPIPIEAAVKQQAHDTIISVFLCDDAAMYNGVPNIFPSICVCSTVEQ